MIEKDNVMCGTMVIVKEDFTPVCNWLLGRIVEVYHGSDGKRKETGTRHQVTLLSSCQLDDRYPGLLWPDVCINVAYSPIVLNVAYH
ncbi:hypothetical protein TNCV_823351 [Trichonephila clavipes]|nr:hypothetical protein TNCV_823351 [Trichonephila clavipes]